MQYDFLLHRKNRQGSFLAIHPILRYNGYIPDSGNCKNGSLSVQNNLTTLMAMRSMESGE